jgi:hypothetical protein
MVSVLGEGGVREGLEGGVGGMVNPGLLMDVVLQPGGSVRLEIPQDWTSFAYVYDGEWGCGGRGRLSLRKGV